MLYIRTADRLTRTAPWVESFEGGVDKLRRIILQDELGICADLDAEMDRLIGTYQDEWKRAVQDPELRKQFRQFVNTVSSIPLVVLSWSMLTDRTSDDPRSSRLKSEGRSERPTGPASSRHTNSTRQALPLPAHNGPGLRLRLLMIYRLPTKTRPVALFVMAKTHNWPSFTFPVKATLRLNKCALTNVHSFWTTVLSVTTRMAISTSHAREC